MKYIYLEEVASHVFNGGEVHIKKVNELIEDNVSIMIIAKLKSSDDIMKLLLVTNALKHLGIDDIHLTMTYVPYARQDRVCCIGEAFSLEVFCKIINAQEYKAVSVCDIHSEVTRDLIKNCVVYTSYSKVKSIVKGHLKGRIICLIYPDKGAKVKVNEFTDMLNAELLPDATIKCMGFNKTRDPSTGIITGLEFDTKIKLDKSCEYIVVDDICDGGRTFIEIAKKMPNMNMTLFVTHGIFSKGTEELQEYYKQIYTTGSFYSQESKLIEVI